MCTAKNWKEQLLLLKTFIWSLSCSHRCYFSSLRCFGFWTGSHFQHDPPTKLLQWPEQQNHNRLISIFTDFGWSPGFNRGLRNEKFPNPAGEFLVLIKLSSRDSSQDVCSLHSWTLDVWNQRWEGRQNLSLRRQVCPSALLRFNTLEDSWQKTDHAKGLDQVQTLQDPSDCWSGVGGKEASFTAPTGEWTQTGTNWISENQWMCWIL